MNQLSILTLLLGRCLLGLYFVLPGISKIASYECTAVYMAEHNVPMISVLLPLTIVIQILAGLSIIVGFHGCWAAFLLAGLTLIINIYMHNFWALPEEIERSHEMQNFIKNMAIFAGLLMVFARGTGEYSLRPKNEN